MTQIANAESTKEVRGWVMLMLMRSEDSAPLVDCEDADVVIACLESLDNCPAACKAEYEEPSDEVVKSGSLVVTAAANSSKNIVKKGVSDMDTLKFKTSEEVTISKVVLERYGRSYYDSVESVRLEDEDGNVLTTSTENSVNNKDKVTLSLKKGYRAVDGTLNAIVRVKTNEASWATIGFKVVDVTSTAKDVDLGNYSPFEYDIIEYTAGDLSISANATEKNYNYVAGESYEVAKFKLRAGTSAVKVRGFTLTNNEGLSDEEFVDEVVVTFDGKEVKGLRYDFDNDDKLVVSFDAEEIAINKNATIVVKATFTEDFDEYNEAIQYYVAETTDIKAVESKTSSQVTVNGANNATSFPKYTFAGSKVKLTNNKLGNVDAAQGAEGVLIAEWTISLNETINKGEVRVPVTAFNPTEVKNHVDHLTLVINGDEYDSKWKDASGYYYFSNVEIEESGKVQLKIDINENEGASGSITFWSLQFVGFKYVQNKNVNVTPVGSITVSKVTLQPAKASMENTMTKSVQYITQDSARKVVFEGTYTAKKGDIYLNKFAINTASDSFKTDNASYPFVRTFYVSIDGEEVGDTDEVLTGLTASNVSDNTPAEDFSDVLVKKWESVKVKVEAEIDAEAEGSYDYELFVWWADESDNTPSGIAYDSMVTINLVNKWSVVIPTASSSKNTVLLKAKNSTLASFVVKPSNNNEGLTLENIVFTGTIAGTPFSWDKIRVKVDGVEYDVENENSTTMEYVINTDLPVEGLVVDVVLKQEAVGNVELTVNNINDAATFSKKTYTRSYADALVSINSQVNNDSFTKYTLAVDLFDDDYEVSNFSLHLWNVNADGTGCAGALITWSSLTSVEDGDTFEVTNWTDSLTIECIQYESNGTKYAFDRDTYNDYFKLANGDSWRVYAKK